MKTEMFENESFIDVPLTDKELFKMLRAAYSNDKDCWETVREAQQVYKEMRKRNVILQMQDEGKVFKDSTAA